MTEELKSCPFCNEGAALIWPWVADNKCTVVHKSKHPIYSRDFKIKECFLLSVVTFPQFHTKEAGNNRMEHTP